MMRKKLSSSFKEYFSFSRGERNGVIILLFLILLLMFTPILYRSFVSPAPSNNSAFYSRVDSFFANLSLKPEEIAKTPSNLIESEELVSRNVDKMHYFDPNTTSIDEFVLFGLSVKQAQVIERYRSKGGKFRTPDDFAKMYVIDSVTFKRLKPWIKISELVASSLKMVSVDSSKKEINTPVIIELNSADTLELTKIKGIGKVYARRIVAYRNLLGGYIKVDQLKEVFGIKPELVESISSQIRVDISRVTQINLNLVTFDELKKHPYVSEYQAKSIIYYRSKVGSIKSIDELIDNKILPKDKFQKIKDYLTIG